MSKPLHRACLVTLSLAGVAAAATPPQTEQRAARGVNTAVVTHGQLLETDRQFVFGTRLIADTALDQLNAATTFSALLAPGGVTLNCPVSGTLNARVSNARLRTLKLDWTHCVSVEFGSRNDVDGPAELTLGENSLQPGMVLSVRLGDLNRDYVLAATPEIPRPSFGGQTLSRNLRVTGPMPMAREYGDGIFLGRYLVEARGFVRRVQRLPDYNPSTGQPSAEFYNFSTTFSTDGALLTGTYTVDGTDNLLEAALIAGKVSARYIYPVRPTKPTKTLDMWFKGAGLSTRRTWDTAASRYAISIEGKVEGDFNQFFPLGCTGPDTFTFHTRVPLTLSPYSYYYEFFEGGELVVDGKSVATFSATGSEQYVDLVGHVLLKVPGVGTFNYDYDEYILESPLADAGRCTP